MIGSKKFRGSKFTMHRRTGVRFAIFLSGAFITAIVVIPPERKLAKCTSVHWGDHRGDHRGDIWSDIWSDLWGVIWGDHRGVILGDSWDDNRGNNRGVIRGEACGRGRWHTTWNILIFNFDFMYLLGDISDGDILGHNFVHLLATKLF